MILRTKITSSSGIYIISSTINENIYIGSAYNLKRRNYQHFRLLKKGYHENPYLQNHYNKYGIDSLWFGIMEFCPKEKLGNVEQWYIDNWKPEFNISKDSKVPMKGRSHKEESKIKCSLSTSGENAYQRTEESLRDQRNSMLGKLVGEKNGMFGKTHTKEAINKNRNWHLNRKSSEQTKQLLKIIMKNRPIQTLSSL